MLKAVRKLRLTSEFVLFFYSFIYTINVTIIPQLLIEKSCYQKCANLTFCQDGQHINQTFQASIQKEASSWTMYYFLCSTSTSLISVLVCGTLSDILGYKRIMLVFPVLGGIQNVIFLLSAQYISLSMWWMLIAAVSVGLYGDISGVVSLCYAVIASFTKNNPGDRTSRMLVLEPTFFLANALGGLISGYLLEFYGYMSVFSLCLCCHLVMFVYIWLFIPGKIEIDECIDSDETCELIKRKGSLNLWHQLIEHFKELWFDTSKESKLTIACLLILYIPATSGIILEFDLTALYLKNSPFNLKPTEIGYVLFTAGITRVIAVIVLSMFVLRHYSVSDYWLLGLAYLSAMLLYISVGISRSFTAVMIVNLFGIFVPVGVCTIRSMVSKYVTQKHHGTILAIIMFVDVTAMICLNFVSLGLYNLTFEFYSGLPYFIIAFFQICALIILFVNRKNL